MYTFEQLKDDVRKEAEALRVHATSEERERLDIETLDPSNVYNCIYGMCTGHCESERASHLIKKCAPTFIASESDPDLMKTTNLYRSYHWSPIEYYIGFPEANNANLISYLRGETETLTL